MRARIDDDGWLRVKPDTKEEHKQLRALEGPMGEVRLTWEDKVKSGMFAVKYPMPKVIDVCQKITKLWNDMATKHKLAKIRKWSGADKLCVEWLIDAGLDTDLMMLIPILPRLDFYMGRKKGSDFVVDLRWLLESRDKIPGLLVQAERVGRREQEHGEAENGVI